MKNLNSFSKIAILVISASIIIGGALILNNQIKINTEITKTEQKRIDLENCLTIAEEKYWSYINLNGELVDETDDELIYEAPTYIWEEAAQIQNNKKEECKILYK